MSDVLEVAGLACVTVAAWTVAAALGWLVLGLGLIVVAQGVEGAVTVDLLRQLVARVMAVAPRRRREAP